MLTGHLDHLTNHFYIFRLVFSQSLISLNLIEDFLEASHCARDSSFKGILFSSVNMNDMSSLTVLYF